MIPNLSKDDAKKVKQLIDEGCHALADIAALREGLKETVDAVGEELDIAPKILNRAIRTVHKENWEELKNDFDDIDALLDSVQAK